MRDERMVPAPIEPVRVGELPRFLAAVEPIARDVAAGDLAGALMRNADALIEATAVGARVERAWLEQQTADVLVELAASVVEANADFFVRQVLPRINAAADRIARIASGGMSGSAGSSPPGSPTAT